jgi:LCP family protein required for cell wall assembly
MKQLIILCILLTLLASSCSIFSVDPTPSPLPTNTKTSTPIPSPTDTQTPSPTPPKTPTPTYTTIPSATPTSPYVWGYFPGPTEDSAIDISPPVDPIPFSVDTVNIILLGSDRRPNIAGYRTDTLLILSLDLEKNTATMLSIPRDLYVFIPGWKVNRINTAEPRGGFEMISDTILYNLGIPLHHWVRVRFEGMIEAIDIMGGIDVITTGPLYDECGGVYYRYDTGNVYHMDGMDALCYTRMRKTSSDFDRLRRQQEVLEAMFSKVISIDGLERVPELYEVFNHTFRSDMNLEEVLDLLPLATSIALDPDQVSRYRIDQTMVQSFRVPSSGASVLLPKHDAISVLLERAFGEE